MCLDYGYEFNQPILITNFKMEVIPCYKMLDNVLSYFKGYFTLVITQIVNNLRPKQKAYVIATNDDVFL